MSCFLLLLGYFYLIVNSPLTIFLQIVSNQLILQLFFTTHQLSYSFGLKSNVMLSDQGLLINSRVNISFVSFSIKFISGTIKKWTDEFEGKWICIIWNLMLVKLVELSCIVLLWIKNREVHYCWIIFYWFISKMHDANSYFFPYFNW